MFKRKKKRRADFESSDQIMDRIAAKQTVGEHVEVTDFGTGRTVTSAETEEARKKLLGSQDVSRGTTEKRA